MNIVDPILFQCKINAEQPAICAPGTRFDLITYAQLAYMTNNLTRAVLSLGFERGQIVGILLQDKIFHIALIIALTRIGVATVSCRDASLPKEINAAAAITDTAGPFANVERVIRANPEWVRGSAAAVVDPRLFEAKGDELCRIILTSGSTGVPKAIAFSHDKLIAKNARLDYCQGFRWSRSSRLFCDLGLSSSQGFRYVLHMLTRGGMVLVFGEDSASTLQSLNLFEIQNMVTAPFGLAEYLKFFESEPSFHCNFDHILIAGGMLTKNLAERAWARMCPNLISLYGATEVGAIATADARVTTSVPGAVGYILPDAQAQIVDPSGKQLAPGTEGIVRVRTEQVVTGYYGDPIASAAMFRDGWFYPGDHGYVGDDGLLVITGRQETRLNLGGDKVNPETVENVLTAFPGVSDAAVLTIPNALGIEEIYALIKSQSLLEEGAFRSYCQARLERTFVPVRFITVDRIPRNESGKIERSRLPELAKSKLSFIP
jgi:acyl-CoA synthetase (AMP-forming)/AMP-acid ligase II